jgi:peroxiredoxin Q/BCP
MSVNPLKKGRKVPSFPVTDQDGNSFSLRDYEGKKVIIFFYPRDNTPTCTEEACNLRDNYQLLQEKGFEVIGVSTDSARKHQNFIKKFSLPFPLIADTDNKLTEAFGVWGEKQLFGRKYMGLVRTTFVIDENSKVAHVIDKVEAKNHTEQLMAALSRGKGKK